MDRSPDVPRVRLYTIARPCPLCEDALALLGELSRDHAFELEVVAVDGDVRLTVLHALKVPVVEVDGREIGHGRLDKTTLERALARGRRGPLGPGADPGHGLPTGSDPPRRLPPNP
jgi:hypothetical protein